MLLKPRFLAKVPKACGHHRAKQGIWYLRWFCILVAVSRKRIHGLLQESQECLTLVFCRQGTFIVSLTGFRVTMAAGGWVCQWGHVLFNSTWKTHPENGQHQLMDCGPGLNTKETARGAPALITASWLWYTVTTHCCLLLSHFRLPDCPWTVSLNKPFPPKAAGLWYSVSAMSAVIQASLPWFWMTSLGCPQFLIIYLIFLRK